MSTARSRRGPCPGARKRPRGWSWPRIAALALALALFAADLARLAHVALAPHARCAEHGELVEETPGEVSDAPVRSRRREAREGGRALLAASGRPRPEPAVDPHARVEGAAASSRHGHAHEHCALAARTARRDGPPVSPALAIPRLAPVSGASVDRSARRLSRFALFRLAPSHSPPT